MTTEHRASGVKLTTDYGFVWFSRGDVSVRVAFTQKPVQHIRSEEWLHLSQPR